MLIIADSGSGKANVLFNWIEGSDNPIEKIYLYAKNLSEPKYRFLIKKREDVGPKRLHDPKSFTEYSSYMDDVYNNIDDCNRTRKRKILTVLDDMIADIMTNKKFQV